MLSSRRVIARLNWVVVNCGENQGDAETREGMQNRKWIGGGATVNNTREFED